MASVTLLLQWLDLVKQQATLFDHPLKLSFLFIISSFILLKFIKGSWSKTHNLPPSPPKLPILGNLHQLGTLVHQSLHDLSKQYGPLMLLNLGSHPTLIVSSPEFARQIMNTHDIAFANRPSTTAEKLLFYGCCDIGFAPYGKYWRLVKKISMVELLSMKRVQSFTCVMEEETAFMIEKISTSSLRGETVNLSEMLLSFSNDVICRCSLGRKHEDSNGKNKFAVLAREAQHLLGAFSFGDFFPYMGWMDVLTGFVGKIKKVSSEIETFFDEIINEHIEQIECVDSEDKKDFVNLLLNVEKSNKFDIKFTRENIKAILMDMFIGGTDTTSTTMEWTMAELLKNPSQMKKAQEEVRRVVGNKSKITQEAIHQMKYLKCILKETLRLHPPLPLIVPRESTTTTSVNGYHVPSKTRVFINAWAIQRDPEAWNDPEAYIPERFSNNPIDFKGQDYEYIPFGSGRRGCPGISFGMTTTEFIIANLLYWFDWELPGGANEEELDMTETFGFTVFKKIPLHLVPTSHSSYTDT